MALNYFSYPLSSHLLLVTMTFIFHAHCLMGKFTKLLDGARSCPVAALKFHLKGGRIQHV